MVRTFGPVVALADASLQLRRHEVLGLVGDNGAGKSTLLKILSGVLNPHGGEVFIDGHAVQIRRAQDAMEAGIETVYQDLALVDTMTAYQNVYLGREVLARSWPLRILDMLDDRLMRKRAREVLNSLAVKIPSVNVGAKGMSGGQRQCLAIGRALLWGRRIVILDEPTAALGVRESEQVLQVIRDLRNHDISVIVVSHNMQQLMEIADRITVMRLGRTIATRSVKDVSVSTIVGLITGAVPGDQESGHGEAGATTVPV